MYFDPNEHENWLSQEAEDLIEKLYLQYKQGPDKRYRHIMQEQPRLYSEAELIHFGNFLLLKYGVMVYSNDGKNEPIYERSVHHADLCNWKDLQRPLMDKSTFAIGDKVKVFLMPEGEDSFPGFTGAIVAVHEFVNKRKYDVELKFDGDFTSRIYNVDEILITAYKDK